MNDAPSLLAYMGTNPVRWAEEFCKLARDRADKGTDPEWVFWWFHEAINAGFYEGSLYRPDPPALHPNEVSANE